MESVPAVFPSTRESTNYARLCHLLTDVGCTVLCDTFDSIHPPVNLHKVLSNPSVFSTLQSLSKERVFHPFQWAKLFPSDASTVSSANFDIALLVVLLKNICDLSPPSSTGSWDKLPPDSDKSTEANIVRIKCYRDDVYGHVTKASVDDATFNALWEKTKSTILALASGTNYSALYETDISQLKDAECMDRYAEAYYKRLLTDWKKDDTLKEVHVELKGNLETATQQILGMLKELLKPQPCGVNTKESLKDRQELSPKQRKFVREPMGEKKVTQLAGIGRALGQRLEEKGFGKAYVVLIQFLLLKQDKEKFLDWIKEACGANKKRGGACYSCLKEWRDAHSS